MINKNVIRRFFFKGFFGLGSHGIIVTFTVCLLIGCGEKNIDPSNFAIKTYSTESLDFPSTPMSIPGSQRDDFFEQFFAPWNQSPEVLSNTLPNYPGKDLTYIEKYLNDDEWYGENKKPHKKEERKSIVYNADVATFPNFQKKGIAITHTNLRRVPTNRPGFDRYSKAGEGFPFDYFQETNLWANTPLNLVHLTKDKQWCYTVSPYYKGWVPMRAIAVVSENFINQWKTENYAIPLSDTLRLENADSYYSINAKMGMVLPFEPSENSDSITTYYVNTDEFQNAHILKAEVDKRHIALDDYEFKAEHLQQLISQLVGRPYGWGGNLQNRDCSSMIRDMMATFRIWLPRDSDDQIEVGKKYELVGSNEEKIALIKKEGIPFRTILRKKGHNMLYVGNNDKGEPLIFHAIWGLKTSYSNKELAKFVKRYPIEGIHQEKNGSLKGRHIIGEAVITSVMAGSDNEDIPESIIEEIYAMATILVKKVD